MTQNADIIAIQGDRLSPTENILKDGFSDYTIAGAPSFSLRVKAMRQILVMDLSVCGPLNLRQKYANSLSVRNLSWQRETYQDHTPILLEIDL